MSHGERHKIRTTTGTRDFLKLRDEWYRHLKDEGFNDIETDANPSKTMTLKHWDSFKFNRLKNDFSDKIHRQSDNITIEATQIYFTKLEQATSRLRFINDLEKQIWGLFITGVPIQTISKRLKITLYRAHTTVKTFLRRLKYDQSTD
jgi:hypothetical protein